MDIRVQPAQPVVLLLLERSKGLPRALEFDEHTSPVPKENPIWGSFSTDPLNLANDIPKLLCRPDYRPFYVRRFQHVSP